MKDLTQTPAYQGRGWQPRRKTLSQELNGRLWSNFRVDSEYAALEDVLLYRPGHELSSIRSPRAVQHLRRVNVIKLRAEIQRLAGVYRRLGVRVHFVDRRAVTLTPIVPPNLVFMRDLFFNSREGAVLARMASAVRAGEEKFTAAALAKLGVPIRQSVSGRGLFEGADALWLNRKTVLCGVGNRTNAEGFAQLALNLRAQGISCVRVRLPKGVQHLLGLVQIVDARTAVLRYQKAGRRIGAVLKCHGFRILGLEESVEIAGRQGLNFVTVKPRHIVMAANCPELKRRLTDFGLNIAAEVEIDQLINAAGGIACATGILARRPLA